MSNENINSLRSYGLPNSEVAGIPVAKPISPDSPFKECPNCGCGQLMEITIEVKQELLKTGKGTETYIGCPACPFASPMMVISHG